DDLRQAERDGPAKTLDRLFNGEAGCDERTAFLEKSGELIARKDHAPQLRGWWLYAMLHSGHPLREKLTLFWHNHFATSLVKVRDTRLMFRQNCLLRQGALGRFGD